MQLVLGDDAHEAKIELLKSLQDRNWQPNKQHDLQEFSNHLGSFVDINLEERFFNMVIGLLYFSDLPDRYETIPRSTQRHFTMGIQQRPSTVQS
jgi:hypothetical protein